MLSATTMAIIRRQVAWRLGCELDELRGSPPLIKAHGTHFAGYHGIYVWLMDDAAVVSAPPEWVAAAQSAIAGQTSEALCDSDVWHAALDPHIERIVGPSYQGYVDSATFRPASPLAPDSA